VCNSRITIITNRQALRDAIARNLDTYIINAFCVSITLNYADTIRANLACTAGNYRTYAV
jgi:tRNA uridine 5-carbamoylmethylation protein Kti12